MFSKDGGDNIHALVFLIFALVLSYSLISYFNIIKKSKYVNSNKLNSNTILSKILEGNNFFSSYLNSVNNKIVALENPYGLNLSKYILIKYFISILFLIVIYFRSKNIFLSLILFFILFFIPNILISSFKRKENLNLIGEISNIVQSLILSLETNISIHQALEISYHTLKYKRFKENYKKFVDNYMLYNLNTKRALEDFSKKFNSYEFNMFVSILLDSNKNIGLKEGLEAFSKTLDVVYFKYLRYRQEKNFLIVSLFTVVSLINIFLLVGYPMAMQISDGFKNLFM